MQNLVPNLSPEVSPTISLNSHVNVSSAPLVSSSADSEVSVIPLHQHVEHAIRKYFIQLDGSEPCNLYEVLLNEVEKPLLEVVLEHTKGNQTQTAKILGLNRGTLRKKLAQYDLL